MQPLTALVPTCAIYRYHITHTQALDLRVSELSGLRTELSNLQAEHLSKVKELEAHVSELEEAVRRAQHQGQGDAATAAKQVGGDR